ncbi:MAG: hypothetical protein GY757_26475 [bacterium]|nr:hypothetical protein [bacterium]
MNKQENKSYPLPDARSPETKKIVLGLRLGTISDNGATPWLTSIPMGKPVQKLNFTIDTGTAYSWVTSTRCTTGACLMHQRFSPTISSSYKQIGDPRSPETIDFGAWGGMKAFLARDFLTLKRMLPADKGPTPAVEPDVKQLMTLYLSKSYDGAQFEDLVWDGAIALPRIQPPDTGSDQLLTLLKDSGMIDVEMVSFYYNEFTGSGQCLFGAVNYRKFDPSTLNYIPVSPLTGKGQEALWSIKLEGMECREKPVLPGNIDFVLDTGSSRFKGDPQFIEKIKCAITNNWELPGVVKGANPEFEEYPVLYLDINGFTYPLKPSQYFMEVSPGVWELAFHGMDGLENTLLVGSVFLNTVYSIFYYNTGNSDEPQVIGLASPLF